MDDFFSAAHFVLGFLAGLLGGWFGFAATAAFLFYETLEDRARGRRDRSVCDIAEYLAGYAAGAALR